jgi:outer membrane receptor protein involved in Fe transport
LSSFRVLGIVVALSAACLTPTLAAQQPNPSAARAAGAGEIRGRLVESGSAAPIGAGSISVRRSTDTAFASGALPNADGSFKVEGLPVGKYTVRVRALGYAPLVRTGIVVTNEQPVVDLGALTLSRVAAQIAGQEVRADRDEVVLAPDRNSYSTKNMTTASGGTAIDVLRNVPAVEVDGSNNVSLRGNSNVVVQINGRSSPLHGDQLANFLSQLPASTVARVEVSTNPSAKNDPEGTAGIINIVLNQEADVGLSGGVNAATGTTGLANVNGNVGRQAGPATAFISYGFFRDSRPIGGFTDQTLLGNTSPAFVRSYIDGSQAPLWQNATFRSEYRFSQHNALTGDAVVSGGRSTRSSASYYSSLDAVGDTIGRFDQFNDALWRSVFQDYAVAFRRTGDAKATTFSTELRFSQGNSTSDAALAGNVQQGDASTGAYAVPREHDVTISNNPSWNLQSDYSHPFGTGTKIEAGYKGMWRNTGSDFSAAYVDSASGQFVPAPERAIVFDYRETINAGYAVLSQQLGNWQTQAGLRLEEAQTRLGMPNAAPDSQHFGAHYASAFPSGIVSYNFTPMRQLKLSYSRRISRPNPYQLTPIVQREDARNLFHGNPDLRPEYTDALELAFQETRGWGTLQLNPYLRHTAHAVRNIQTVDSTGVTTGTFDNVASAVTVGSDLNVSIRRGPLTLFTGGSVFHYQSDASNLTATFGNNLSTRAMFWATRANATWKFSPVLDLQMFASYRAPYTTEGSSQTAMVFSNIAVRRKLWGDQGSLTVRIADPFNMMSFGTRMTTGNVIQLSERRFGMRGVFINISRNFGQQLKLRPRPQDDPQQGPQQPGVP